MRTLPARIKKLGLPCALCVISTLCVLCACELARAQPAAARLLVLNKEEAALVIVDAASKRILGRVPTGDGPHELTVSSDGKLAFVGNYGTAQAPGSTISVIDLAAQKELRRVDLGALRRPHGMFFADAKVYFTAETNRLIGRYDPAANQIDWLQGTGQTSTHMVMVSKDLTRIFTANIGSDSISIFERGQNPLNWTLTHVGVGKGPEGIDLSADGRELWTAHSRDGGVSVIDVASKKVTQTIDIRTKRSNRIKLTPDGKLALISDLDAGELIVLDASARKEIKRITLGKMPEGILIPPAADVAYVAVNGDNFVAIVDLKTLDVIGRISTGKGPDGMAWVQP